MVRRGARRGWQLFQMLFFLFFFACDTTIPALLQHVVFVFDFASLEASQRTMDRRNGIGRCLPHWFFFIYLFLPTQCSSFLSIQQIRKDIYLHVGVYEAFSFKIAYGGSVYCVKNQLSHGIQH